MDLKEIALDAVKSAQGSGEGRGTLPPQFAERDNGDGTVTLSVLVKFDPKVRKEKAAAMAKGVKRDDLVDDIPDSGAEETEDSAPEFPLFAPAGMLETACDEVVDEPAEDSGCEACAEDAFTKTHHGVSPIANCRAKDLMYCPYHGQKAIVAAVEAQLKSAGIQGTTVEVKKAGDGYRLEVTYPASAVNSLSYDVHQAMFRAFAHKNGVQLNAPQNAANSLNGLGIASMQGGDVLFGDVSVPKGGDEKSVAMMDEWIDDLMTDVASDPQMMSSLDPQDFRDMLDACDAVDGIMASNARYASDPAYVQAMSDCSAHYHNCRAQVDYAHLATIQDVKDEKTNIAADVSYPRLKHVGFRWIQRFTDATHAAASPPFCLASDAAPAPDKIRFPSASMFCAAL